MDRSLWLRARVFFLALAKHDIARRIARGSLPSRMQGLKKGDERRGFRRTQVLPIRGHVAASLDHLADELVLRQPHSDAIQRRASLPAHLTQRMAVAALFDLKDECALTLHRGCAMEKSLRHRITAPGVHVRTPGCDSGKMRQCPQRYRDQQDREDCDWPSSPTFFAFT